MPDALLTATQLACERNERVLFERLSFTLGDGDVLQVEGPNGSGKTTLLRVLCGLSRNYRGELSWRGAPLARAFGDYTAELLYLGHLPGINSVLTPRENLRWWCGLRAPRAARDIDAALARIGLRGCGDQPCYRLSAGQQRRVALARLFLSDAVLWILDEPFTAIDKQGVRELEAAIETHVRGGGAVVLTSHQDLQSARASQRLRLGEAQP